MNDNIKGELNFSVGKAGYNLKFERYYLSEQIERIKVYGKEKELLLQCDRPEIKLNNKRRAVKWKIISQLNPEIYKYPLFIATLTIELEHALDKIDFPRQSYEHPKNAK